MYLYEQKNYIINVYSFIENKEAIKEYKEKIIKEKGITFYKLTTTEEKTKNRFIKEPEINIRELINFSESSTYTNLSKEINLSKIKIEFQNKIIEDYIEGKYSYQKPTRIYKQEKDQIVFINNLLMTTDTSKKEIQQNNKKTKIFTLNNILGLPDELYALQLLESGDFKQLIYSGLEYEELLNLFTITKETTIPISAEQLKILFDTKLVDSKYFNTLSKMESTAKILSRIKK